jgi:FAD/FMN-containing dehydrogenase
VPVANLRRFAEKLREAMPTAKLLVLAMHFGDGIIWVANKKEVNLYILINIVIYIYFI